MNKPLTILIADDHILVRKGLRQVLESQLGIVVLEAQNGSEALRCIREQMPRIAILDVGMPIMTGFEIARQVRQESLKTEIIFLTMFNDETAFNKAMDLGVKGYVLKENTVAEILACIESVSKGHHYLSPSMSDHMVHRATKKAPAAPIEDGLSRITSAERKVLKLLSTMKTNNEIADSLHISIKTVHNHRNNICAKLGLRGAHALLRFAVENMTRW